MSRTAVLCASLAACAVLAGSSIIHAQGGPAPQPTAPTATPPIPAGSAIPGQPVPSGAPTPGPTGTATAYPPVAPPPATAPAPGYGAQPPYGQPGAYGQPGPYGQPGAYGQPGPYGQPTGYGPPRAYAAPGQLPGQVAAQWGWNTSCPPGCGPCKEFPGKLKYHENQPIPPGYQVEGEPIMGVVIAGTVTLGTFWLVSFTAGIGLQDEENQSSSSSYREYFWPLVFPVVGPFITMGTTDAEGPGTAVLLLDGILQTGGLIMLIAGVAAKQDVLVWKGDSGVAVRPVPVVLGTEGGGLGMSLSF